MSQSAFQPTGDVARWRTLYDLLKNKQVDVVLSYEEMGEALDLHARRDRTKIQLAMRRAAKELETNDARAVESVTGRGYRIVEPEHHLVLARRHQKKAGRSLARGHSKVVHVDFNGMDPEVRKAFEATAGAFASVMDLQRRLLGRQNRLEETLQQVSVTGEQRAERTDTELAELRERLARLEGGKD